jgi:uncharacterized membrane protein
MSDSEERSTRDRLRKQSQEILQRPQVILQKVPWSEIRKQMLTSLGVAFGALIGFMWTNVVQQLFYVAGVIPGTGIHDLGAWFVYAFGAVVVTFISVIMLILLARSQAKAEQKKT